MTRMAATPNWRVNSIDSFRKVRPVRILLPFRAALPVPKDRAANLVSWSQCFDCTYGQVTLNRSFDLRRSKACWPSLARLLSRAFSVHVDRELHCRRNRLLNDCCNRMFAGFRSYRRGGSLDAQPKSVRKVAARQIVRLFDLFREDECRENWQECSSPGRLSL